MSEASSNLARYDGLRYGKMSDDFSGDVYNVFSRTRGEGFGPFFKNFLTINEMAVDFLLNLSFCEC